MKQFFLFVLALIGTGVSFAQSGSAKQVKWTFTSKKISDNVYEVRFVADINGDYHMYAQAAGVEGPVPTLFKFTPNPLVAMDGKVKEQGKLVTKFEPSWDGKVNYYEHKVEFVQKVKLKGKVKTNLAGKVEFMVCNDNLCLPASEVDFKVALGG
jgi:thiol:disulfide interchange protein DsbD